MAKKWSPQRKLRYELVEGMPVFWEKREEIAKLAEPHLEVLIENLTDSQLNSVIELAKLAYRHGYNNAEYDTAEMDY